MPSYRLMSDSPSTLLPPGPNFGSYFAASSFLSQPNIPFTWTCRSLDMAPINQHAAVTVLSTTVFSNDERSIVVEAGSFTPIRCFMEYASKAAVDGNEEPPAKRRKIKDEDGDGPAQAILPAAPFDNDIIIHRVSIDLHFPETLVTDPAKEQALDDVDFEGAEEILVIPDGIENDDVGSRLRLTSSHKKSNVLVVECTHVPDIVWNALQQIVLPGKVKMAYSGERTQSNPATNLRCILKRSIGQLYNVVRLEACVSWCSGVSAFPAGMYISQNRINEDYELLTRAYRDCARDGLDHSQPWTPDDFYGSVHVPSKEICTTRILNSMLESDLYPFQKRAVLWMLRREGVTIKDGRLQNIPRSERIKEISNFYQKAQDVYGGTCYVNHFEGIISRLVPVEYDDVLSGGLLAEEMGLGKTVELLALLTVHPRSEIDHLQVHDEFSGALVTPSNATLIITPATILQQWKSELIRHAPNLMVYQYDGIPGHAKNSEGNARIVQDLAAKYDVVLTTYSTLRREVHFAADPPKRNMRHAPKFERTRSPLVQIKWWRICLDEAQMVESGATAAARVACRLPRVHSWAVSGTPLRRNVQDLRGLLIFLRYQPISDNANLWGHLIKNHRHLFRRIIGDIALRHTKAYIREELHLPAQKRVVLTVPFSAIEHQHYSTLFAEMCEDVGVNSDGSPKGGAWNPEDSRTIEVMRGWLLRLRQTCLHPQVGGRNRRALGRGQGPLRTVAEVLEVMIDQNESNIRIEERAMLQVQLLRGHIVGNNGEDEHRAEKALHIYKQAMETSAKLVQEARERLTAANFAASESKTAEETDVEESASESTPVLGPLRNVLRVTLQIQHICTFFAATAVFQIKSNQTLTQQDSEDFKRLEENEIHLYDTAKLLRKEILKDTARKAEALMRKIKDLKSEGKLIKMPAIHDLKFGGIEGRRIVEKSDELFDIMRGQSQIIIEWRAKMAEYLLKPLVDEDGDDIETTGEEYETSTKEQDELYVYFDAFKAIHADLNTCTTGENAALIDHEVKTLIVAAKKFLDPDDEYHGVVHAPELLLELMEKRNKFRSRAEEVGCVRGLIQEARSLETLMQHGSRGEIERKMIRGHLTALQRVFSEYAKALTELERELALFRSAQNQRVEFYRQLQELSDAVAPYKEELDVHLDLQSLDAATNKENHISTKLAQLKTKQRFLEHLREESATKSSSPRICVICQCQFEIGVLTVCGHQYCKECIGHWWIQHRTCPVCKRRLTQADFHNITYKPKELNAREEVHSGSSSPGSRVSSISPSLCQFSTSIYSDVDAKLMEEIKSIDLPSSYGTKVDTLGRHLHWIREHDPGAKSIVFSQYRQFLDVLSTALCEFKIGHARLGKPGAAEKFRHDPSIDCLLLDAKTDSSGLTLVNATHVIICEPLIQAAIELQAIARVHRIGQTRPTTVWMYLVNDTVEEAIYEISVARRLEHIQSRQPQSGRGKSCSNSPELAQENALDAANSEELQSAPLSKLLAADKGGGELVGNRDLWQCLFGKILKSTGKPSRETEMEVGRHLRAEAAEQRRLAPV